MSEPFSSGGSAAAVKVYGLASVTVASIVLASVARVMLGLVNRKINTL